MSSEAANPRAMVFHHPRESWIEPSPHGPIVHTRGSAGVLLDDALARLWESADDRTLDELESLPWFQNRQFLDAELTTLRAAGLLLPPFERAVLSKGNVPDPPPLASVVIVSRNGWHHLEELLPSLKEQTYPRLEVIVVDDQSADGTDQFIQEKFPSVKIVKQNGGPNFAAGCNRGIAEASGELILLLNNDTVLDPHCVEEMVAAQVHRANVGGVAAMLRMYDNRPFINGLGTFVPTNGLGHGRDLAMGCLDVGQFDRVEQVPLLCFGAALISRIAVEQTGSIDSGYEFYYEDADWSYRARALGFDLIAAPRAKVYHKFGASIGALNPAFKVRLATRNRLRFALKNFRLAELIRRLLSHAREDLAYSIKYLERRQGRQSVAIAQGWGEFLWSVPRILVHRHRMWKGRARRPVNLSALAKPFVSPWSDWAFPFLSQSRVEVAYRPYLARGVAMRNRGPRVLVISPDSVDAKMGGVGIRYWELAHALANIAQVTLAVPHKTQLVPRTFSFQTYTQGRSETLQPLVDAAEIVMLSGFVMWHHPFLRHIRQHLIVDLYDPTVLENLERFSARTMDEQNGLHNVGIVACNDLILLGDFFICASEKQRDYWLGALSAANRVTPMAYADDPILRRLIDVVPFGLPNDPPQHTQRVLKGVRPGIGEDDQVILWGGGLWDWLDPLTAIEAMPRVLDCAPHARLFFMGTKHPNPDVPPPRKAQRAMERADELGLKDRAIFFNDWVPYALRANYLLEADAGISLHGDHIETHFSVRTRVMDYLWASLPMVVTGGDTLSDVIAENGLGRVVSPGDVESVAKGLIEILQSPMDRARFQPVTKSFRWSRVAEPLIRYVNAPWRNGERRTVVTARAG